MVVDASGSTGTSLSQTSTPGKDMGKTSAPHPFGPQTMAFDLQAVVTCPETHQNLISAVTASACKPVVDVSLKSLKFGECPLGDHRDVLVTVKNPGTTLPMDFAVSKVCVSVQRLAACSSGLSCECMLLCRLLASA